MSILTKHNKMMNYKHNHNSSQLDENLEYQDLKRLVHPQLHIDEYKSKMGDDQDVCVLSFLVTSKEPSMDLVSFIEKGYDWILDADVSSGEKEDGKYLVFVETDRNDSLPENVFQLVEDILNLTAQNIDEWTVRWYKKTKQLPLTIETIREIVPLTADDYIARTEKIDDKIDQLKLAAGINVDTTAPKNDLTENMRILAGIK